MNPIQPIMDQLAEAKAEQFKEFNWTDSSTAVKAIRVNLNRFERDQLDLINRIERLIEEEL